MFWMPVREFMVADVTITKNWNETPPEVERAGVFM